MPLLAASWAICHAQIDAAKITVRVDKPGVKVSPTFYGLMTEEINHSYDGGLYGELLQNRSFRDSTKATPHWRMISKDGLSGDISLDFSAGSTPLDVSLRLDSKGGEVGVVNDGYWGIPTRPHTSYKVSFYAKGLLDGSPLSVSIESEDGTHSYAKASVGATSTGWKHYTAILKTDGSTASTSGRFVIWTTATGSVWFRDVSLFQPTFHNRANGNRIDLMQMLDGMKPSFLRLPGGNYLEGDTIPERFEWKDTIGDVAKRAGHQGPWGYRSTDGLGLIEFLEWCEDLKMQPVLAVYAGYSLRGDHVEPGADLKPFVEDALDEIEYVNGSVKTKWGAVRAKNGHPKPFPLTYVEIGNEDGFDRSGTYDRRFAQFFDAIKAKYPHLQLISTATIKSRTPDVIDEHYYRSSDEMARDAIHYDGYDRKGPKIFVGEWASIGGNPTPTFNEALGDAAWLTGMERNSDIVVMEAYAPLLVNVNPHGSQWPTNLIGYNGLNSFGSPSYYVQSMFGNYTGNTVLPVSIKLPKVAPAKLPVRHGAIGVGTWITDSEYKDVRVTAGSKTLYASDIAKGTSDWTKQSGKWSVEDGSLRQSSLDEDTLSTVGDPKWTDYSLSLKARKLSGNEGFLVAFHYQSRRSFLRWNIGGWGNSRSAIQREDNGSLDEVGRPTDTTVETGRWYDIRIDVHGPKIDCYLDGKLIESAFEEPRPAVNPLYAAASVDSQTGDIYLKIVNVSQVSQRVDVSLEGLSTGVSEAMGLVLTGNREDANTVEEPTKVGPKHVRVKVVDDAIHHVFPAGSITVLKIKGKH